MALDDLGDKPLIVRSSSLLEDRMGTAFSGKYKSLFLANQGTKQEKLEALTDAIAEVYASIFGPDPIEYRAERGLLDFHEEMGIMIQEVVGKQGGRLLFPRLRRRRLQQQRIPLVVADQARGRAGPDRARSGHPRRGPRERRLPDPDLARASPTCASTSPPRRRCAILPKRIDVINLKTCTFETKEIPRPAEGVRQRISRASTRSSRSTRTTTSTRPRPSNLDFEKHNLFVTFEGLISRTPFVKQLQTILKTLQEKMNTPVDIEFAADGKNLYLLQCRPAEPPRPGTCPAPIPKDIAPGTGHLLGQPLHLQRQGPGHHAHRLRRPRQIQPAGNKRGHAGGRAGGRQAEQPAAQAPVRPDGAGALGEPRRHQAGGDRSPIRISTTPRP